VPDPLTATELRASIYRVLDEVIETGQPREIVRRGERLLLVPTGAARRRRLDVPPPERAMGCTFEELVETRWEYTPDDDVLGT